MVLGVVEDYEYSGTGSILVPKQATLVRLQRRLDRAGKRYGEELASPDLREAAIRRHRLLPARYRSGDAGRRRMGGTSRTSDDMTVIVARMGKLARNACR